MRYRRRGLFHAGALQVLCTIAVAVGVVAAPDVGARTTTPYLDAIVRVLRESSPSLEGSVWGRSDDNRLDTLSGGPAGWLLQTPGCWGDPKCAQRPGTTRLLAAITSNISHATRTVDISTLGPFPDGRFQDAIVAGLKAAVAAGHRLAVRVLVGSQPVDSRSYLNELVDSLGQAASQVRLNVASMATDFGAGAWNHSKLLVVDGKTVITGGINDFATQYIDTGDPVADVDLALSGPAVTPAARFLDRLWMWTCRHGGPGVATGLTGVGVWLTSTNGTSCMATLEHDANPNPVTATGSVPVIAVGGLGLGIDAVDPASTYHPALPADAGACVGNVNPLHDAVNADRDSDTVNPHSLAQRELIANARSHIEISQQDMTGICPYPSYDVRLFDILASKLKGGVKVRIVVSDPGSYAPFGIGYSNITSLAQISNPLLNRLTLLTGSAEIARRIMCSNLQLAPIREAATSAWADGNPYRQHSKLIVVDDSVFYIGSKNLYPTSLQDYGYIVESPTAAAQLTANLLDLQWRYSQTAATVDYRRGVCPE